MGKVSNKLNVFLLFGIALILCFGLLGCSSAPASSEEAASSDSSSEVVDDTLVLGEETETALNVMFTNETGNEIANIAVVPAGVTDEPAFLMTEEQVLAGSKKASVFTEPYGEQRTFDVVLTIGDAQYVLHNLDFSQLSEVTIRMDGNVAYIESLIDGQPVSTLQQEYDIANPPADEAAQPSPEEQAAVDSAPAQPYTDPAATPAAPTAPTQAPVPQVEDRCVNDLVLR